MIYKWNPNNEVDDSSIESFSIFIPRDYARGTTNTYPRANELEDVPNYKLIIFKQVGGVYTRKPTYVLWELPSGRLVSIILYPDGGIDFKQDEHKFILRETDELDRRIIKGFCKMYSSTLKYASHTPYKKDKYLSLISAAHFYKASKMPKRIKMGKSKYDMGWFYKDILEPYEESSQLGIFAEAKFIGEAI